jgi:methylaspartate mutase epsilon subunit
VLSEHPSGRGVDFDEAAAWHRSRPAEESLPAALAAAGAAGATLLQPRSGVPTPRAQRRLLEVLRDLGGADVLSLTIDSHTRQHDFARAAAGLADAEATGRTDTLNGFPAISVGVEGCRRVAAGLGCPVEVRHGHPDARLLAEVGIAGGCTGFEGGAITYCVPYSRSCSIDESVACWQYVDRLCAEYGRRGVAIDRESFGALTGLMVPPAVAIACGVLEMLLAVEQGVTSFSVGYAQLGQLTQDVAALRALRALAVRYGGSLDVSTVFYQWMGPFPREAAEACAIIALASATAAIARPTRMIVKSPEEAHGIPSPEANSQGLLLSRAMLDWFGSATDEAAVAEEQAWIEREAESILGAVLRRAEVEGLRRAVVRAFAEGVLDVPFAPNEHVRGAIAPCRDRTRAVRYARFGSLPFDAEVKARNDRLVRGARPPASSVLGDLEGSLALLTELESAGASGR